MSQTVDRGPAANRDQATRRKSPDLRAPKADVGGRPLFATGENFPAELLISADGRFLYGSNRGDNTIAVFATAADGLSVELVQTIGSGGDWPRHLAFSNDGRTLYAANERSDQIATFSIDDGRLTATGEPVSWPKPVCILPV